MTSVLKTPPDNVCILRLSAIGDVTHVLPTLRILQKSWPKTRITWIIGKTELSLVKDIEGVEFISFDKSRGFKALLDLRKQLAGRRFDLLLNMQVSPRAALASLCISAATKLGYDRKRGKALHNLLVNQRINAIGCQHVLDSFLEFPKALGLQTDEIIWDIPISTAVRKKVAEKVPQSTYLVINPCSSIRARNYRNWSSEAYAKIIEYAADRFNLQTVLTGGPATKETDYAAEICQKTVQKPLNLVGKTDLKELLAILDGAKLVISPDTGPAHMANALGTPVIGLYATSNPLRSGPYCQRELTVNRYPDAIQQEFNKSANEVPWGQRVRNPKAMNLITLADVKGKLDSLLG